MQAYSDPKRANDPHALPDVETWYVTEMVAQLSRKQAQADSDGDDEGPTPSAGWYWWSCSPGCLPDGDPQGPFATEAEALADAQEGCEDDDE